MPQSARLSAGRRGSNGYLGNAQMNRDIYSVGLPLGSMSVYLWQNQKSDFRNKENQIIYPQQVRFLLHCQSGTILPSLLVQYPTQKLTKKLFWRSHHPAFRESTCANNFQNGDCDNQVYSLFNITDSPVLRNKSTGSLLSPFDLLWSEVANSFNASLTPPSTR